MSEIETDVVMKRVDLLCDGCGDGHMHFVRKSRKKYIHQCDNCLEEAVCDIKYPYYVGADGKRIKCPSG